MNGWCDHKSLLGEKSKDPLNWGCVQDVQGEQTVKKSWDEQQDSVYDYSSY